MADIEFTDKKTGTEIKYYMDGHLKKNIDDKIIPSLQKKDKDFLLAIDGTEGAGKSTLAMQIGKHVDPTLDVSRVVFCAEDFREAIFKAKKGQCVIFDEAFTGLSSRSALSAVNRSLVSLMMQMRQKNLFVIIVLPTFFLLDKYVAIWRARVLIHVYENKGIRGYFRLYNKKLKKYLYLAGKQTYSYNHKSVYTRFKGRFYGVFALGDDKVEELYKSNKAKALEATEKNPMTSAQVKFRDQRNICLLLLRRKLKLSYRELANLLSDYDFDMSHVQLSSICAKFGDKEDKREETEVKNTESDDSDKKKEEKVVETPESDGFDSEKGKK